MVVWFCYNESEYHEIIILSRSLSSRTATIPESICNQTVPTPTQPPSPRGGLRRGIMSLPLDNPFPARGGEVGLSQRGTVPAQSGVVVHWVRGVKRRLKESGWNCWIDFEITIDHSLTIIDVVDNNRRIS